jgi:hypothetical protein
MNTTHSLSLTRSLTKLLTCFLLLIVSEKLIASDVYNKLSLNDAVRIALENNVQQRISLQAAAIAESQYQEALSAH